MKKNVTHCIILLILISSCLFWLFNRPSSKLNDKPSRPNSEQEELIVPAIIDSVSDILHISALQNGIIKKFNVTGGQTVKKGQILCELENTQAKHNVLLHQIALKQTKTGIFMQTKNLEHLKIQLERLQSIDKRAIQPIKLIEKKHEITMGLMQLKQLKRDLKIALVNLKNAELTLKHHTITAPKDGVVLQISKHMNEYIRVSEPFIFLGDAKKIIVRISIDERDTQKFSTHANAYLTDDNNDGLNIPLHFLQLNHYIITQENLNARVQEALYFFDRDTYPKLAAGQQFDAHIIIKTS